MEITKVHFDDNAGNSFILYNEDDTVYLEKTGISQYEDSWKQLTITHGREIFFAIHGYSGTNGDIVEYQTLFEMVY